MLQVLLSLLAALKGEPSIKVHLSLKTLGFSHKKGGSAAKCMQICSVLFCFCVLVPESTKTKNRERCAISPFSNFLVVFPYSKSSFVAVDDDDDDDI